MLKFVKHHMETIAGVGIWPVLSFLIFFLFFLGVLLYLRRARRDHIAYMAALPLNDGPTDNAHERHE